ncbi:MAG: hypothetical protein UHO63_10605 [Blautia sp.]|nr:hypothetical protein [Blautia sp.]
MKKKAALVLGVVLLCCFGLAACKGRGEGDKKEESFLYTLNKPRD